MAKQSELERRLAELDGQRARGVLSDEEYQLRRAAIIADASSPAAQKKGGFPIFRVGCLGLVGVVVLVIVIASVASGGGKDTKQASSGGNGAVVGTNKGDVHVPLAVDSSGTIAPERNDNKRTKVTILAISDNARSTNQFTQPGQGKKFWAVQVMVENVGTAEVTSLDWKLRDSKDNEMDRRFVSGIGENLQFTSALTPGGRVSGWLVFEIDADASPKWLRADPNPFLKNDLYFDAQ